MATKKAKTKTAGTEVAVRKATNIVSIQEALRAQAAQMGEKTAPVGGSAIRITQDKKFALPDGTTSEGPLDVVIIEFISRNTFYEGAYDAKNISPPACFAIGTNPLKMFPSPNSPAKQSDACQGCPMNEFGSDGDGKACKNTRLLAVLPPDADEDTPIWTLSVSPSAIKGFDGYVKTVASKFNLPPIGVITTVEFDPSVPYAKLRFSDPRPNPRVADMFGRQDEARGIIATEPDVSNYTPVKKAAGGGRRR